MAVRVTDSDKNSRLIPEVSEVGRYVGSEVEKEKSRATIAESSLQTLLDNLSQNLGDRISDEVDRAQKAESQLMTSLEEETQRAQSEETRLGSDLDTEVSRAQGAESSLRTSLDAEVSRSSQSDLDLTERVLNIYERIPQQAGPDNLLADRDFVNSSIAQMAANRVTYDAEGNAFPTRSSLQNARVFYNKGVVYTPDSSDYALVISDEGAPTPFTGGQTRFEFDGNSWVYAYGINDKPFTSDERAAIESGVTKEKVAEISTKMTKLGEGSTTRVKITYPTGLEGEVPISYDADPNTLVQRNSDGRIVAEDAVSDKDVVNKSQLDKKADVYEVSGKKVDCKHNYENKLDKVTTKSTQQCVYTVNTDGSQIMVTSGTSSTAQTLPRRGSDGNFDVECENPISEKRCANLQWVKDYTKSKADKYAGKMGLTQLSAGDNLKGSTILSDSESLLSILYEERGTKIVEFTNGGYIGASKGNFQSAAIELGTQADDILIELGTTPNVGVVWGDESGLVVYNAEGSLIGILTSGYFNGSEQSWVAHGDYAFTFPDDSDWVVSAINIPNDPRWNDLSKLSFSILVDCEYNYNQIKNLKLVPRPYNYVGTVTGTRKSSSSDRLGMYLAGLTHNIRGQCLFIGTVDIPYQGGRFVGNVCFEYDFGEGIDQALSLGWIYVGNVPCANLSEGASNYIDPVFLIRNGDPYFQPTADSANTAGQAYATFSIFTKEEIIII